MKKLDRKRPNLPLIQAFMDPAKEIVDKYAPLHELKYQTKIEGIDIGLEQEAANQKV